MNTKKIIPFLLLAVTGIKSSAQSSTVFLTLDSAIQMSLAQSKQLKIDQAKIESARAKYQQARSMELPTAKISASYTRLSDNVDPFAIKLPGSNAEKELNPQILNRYNPALSVSQTLYAGGQIKYAERSMQLLEEASRLDFEKNRTQIVYNTINAYFNLFKIQQTKKAIEENINQVRVHVKDIRNYEKNGLALKNDVLRIELQLSNLEHSLIEANSALEIAGYNMSIILGLPAGSDYQLADKDFNRQFSLMSSDDYLNEALVNRADLKAINKRMGSAVLDIKSAAGNYYPTISIGGNYYYTNPNARVFPQEDKFKATWDAGVTVSWNLHSLYTNKHRIAENKAILSQKQSEKEFLADAIKTEVNTDYITYIKNKERIRVSEQTVAQAEENYRIVNNRFRNNTVLISDLTDASNLLLQSKISLLVDKADADLAYYKLLQSTGSIK